MNTTAVNGNHYQAQDTANTSAKKVNYGRTVGDVKLSDEAAKYYDELKKKFSDMDFVLVSDDMKEKAEANSALYANPTKPVVLINVSKIEDMAKDETVRAKYEGILSNARNQLSDFASQVAGTGADVQGYGIKIDDNGAAKYFAVLKQSSDAQKARIEKHTEEVRAEKRAAQRKEAKEAQKERLEGAKEDADEPQTVTLTANSLDELMQKISDFVFTQKADTVQTEAEKSVGQNFDFSV